jgi:hypothetical protein
MIYRLAAVGMVRLTKNEAGRLWRIKLSAEGETALLDPTGGRVSRLLETAPPTRVGG